MLAFQTIEQINQRLDKLAESWLLALSLANSQPRLLNKVACEIINTIPYVIYSSCNIASKADWKKFGETWERIVSLTHNIDLKKFTAIKADKIPPKTLQAFDSAFRRLTGMIGQPLKDKVFVLYKKLTELLVNKLISSKNIKRWYDLSNLFAKNSLNANSIKNEVVGIYLEKASQLKKQDTQGKRYLSLANQLYTLVPNKEKRVSLLQDIISGCYFVDFSYNHLRRKKLIDALKKEVGEKEASTFIQILEGNIMLDNNVDFSPEPQIVDYVPSTDETLDMPNFKKELKDDFQSKTAPTEFSFFQPPSERKLHAHDDEFGVIEFIVVANNGVWGSETGVCALISLKVKKDVFVRNLRESIKSEDSTIKMLWSRELRNEFLYKKEDLNKRDNDWVRLHTIKDRQSIIIGQLNEMVTSFNTNRTDKLGVNAIKEYYKNNRLSPDLTKTRDTFLKLYTEGDNLETEKIDLLNRMCNDKKYATFYLNKLDRENWFGIPLVKIYCLMNNVCLRVWGHQTDHNDPLKLDRHHSYLKKNAAETIDIIFYGHHFEKLRISRHTPSPPKEKNITGHKRNRDEIEDQPKKEMGEAEEMEDAEEDDNSSSDDGNQGPASKKPKIM